MRNVAFLIGVVSLCSLGCETENAESSADAGATLNPSGSASSGETAAPATSTTSPLPATSASTSASTSGSNTSEPSGTQDPPLSSSSSASEGGAGGMPDLQPPNGGGGQGGGTGETDADAGATGSDTMEQTDGNPDGGAESSGEDTTDPAIDAGDEGVTGTDPTDGGDTTGPIDSGGPLPALVISSDTNSIEFTPALYAAENLYPGEASVITGGIPLLLSDDSVDLGTNAETQTLRRSVERPDLRIIFTVTETFYRIIARRSRGIESVEDLAGKRVGTPAQTSAAFYVYKTLSLAGLEIGNGSGQVQVSSVFPGQQMVTAINGDNPSVDAIAAWEPYPQLALDELGGVEGDGVILQDRDVYREIVNLHSTTAKLDDPEKRRGIVAFVRALMDAQEWYRENPAEAQEFVGETLGHPADLMERVWEDERFGGELVPDLLDVMEEEELWLADQEGRQPRTREELAPLVDSSIAEEAMALP